MKRHVLISCLTATLLVLPRAALAQAQPAAAKPAAQNKSQEGPSELKPMPATVDAAKPAGEPLNAVKSAAFADLDNDGDPDILAYELLANDVRYHYHVLAPQAANDTASYIQLIARIEDEGGIGASLSPAGDALQAQLKLTKGQGLVVTQVKADSPAAKAGLQVDDILLSVGDRPLAKPSDVSDIVNSPVKKPFTVEFTVLRAGERRKLPLTLAEDTAVHRSLVQLALKTVEAPSYRIGVEVSDASSTLRTQLKLPKDQGIVIDRVLPESPAQKAGFQDHDVLVAADGKPLTKSEDLSAAVKASEGKALKFSLLRGGQPSAITVTPEKRSDTSAILRTRTRQLASDQLLKTYYLRRAKEAELTVKDRVARLVQEPAGDTAAQIERMLKQIDDLRDSVKGLQSTVAKAQKSSPKPTPSKTDLPKTELPTKPEPAKN